jgi:plasmid maintenance system antidote protein VapI
MKIVATLPPLHPGEMLREEFLKPMGLTPYKVKREAA